MEILENAGQAKDGIIGGLKSIVTNAEETLTGACESGAIQAAKQKLEEAIVEAKFMLGQVQDIVVDNAKKAAVGTVEYAKENPVKTAGIILGIGAVLGFFVGRGIYKKN